MPSNTSHWYAEEYFQQTWIWQWRTIPGRCQLECSSSYHMNGIHQRPWKGNPNTSESELFVQGSGNIYEWHIFLSCIRIFSGDGQESALPYFFHETISAKFGIWIWVKWTITHSLTWILLKGSALLQAKTILKMQLSVTFIFKCQLGNLGERQTERR